MGRLVRILLFGIVGAIGLAVVAAVAMYLFFDPNDFRDDISAQVKAATDWVTRCRGGGKGRVTIHTFKGDVRLCNE